MSKDQFKTRLQIAKKKLLKRDSIEKKYKEFYDYWYSSEEKVIFQ